MLNTFAIHHDGLIAKTAILTPYFLYGGINPRFDRSHGQPRVKRDGHIKSYNQMMLVAAQAPIDGRIYPNHGC
jgi:hypothetical protein